MRCRRDTTAYIKDLARLVTNPCHNKCTILLRTSSRECRVLVCIKSVLTVPDRLPSPTAWSGPRKWGI